MFSVSNEYLYLHLPALVGQCRYGTIYVCLRGYIVLGTCIHL